MATLAQCIEIHETARRQEPAAGPTPKGIAVVAIYQIRRALIDLSREDRDEVRELVVDMLNDDRARAIYAAGALAVKEAP